MPAFPQIREQDATLEIAAIHSEIKIGSGPPLVNLIWRHLAVFPGVLSRRKWLGAGSGAGGWAPVPCPLRVISGRRKVFSPCPLYPRKRTSVGHRSMSAIVGAPGSTAGL